MNCHQRLLGPWAQVVDSLGNKLLAGPALAKHQHAGARRCHLLHHLKNFLHSRRFTDDVLKAKLIIYLTS